MSDRSYDGYVRVSQVHGIDMVTLRANLADPAIGKIVSRQTRVSMPTQGQIATGGEAIGWMSPDEALILCDDGAATATALHEALRGHHALAADVSDARVMFALNGAAVREVLAKLTPVDVADVEIGQLRRTRLAQIAAAFWFEAEDHAHVVCFASVADYAFALLCNAARPGSEVFG